MSTARIWFDGACEPYNPGGHGTWGFVVKDSDGVVATERGYIGEGDGVTNNVAEYTALTHALEYAREELDVDTLHVHGDSQLVIRQLTGEYDVNSQRLRPLWREARRLCNDFEERHFQWVPREENVEADALAEREYEERAYPDRLERAKSEDMSVSPREDGTYLVKDEYVVDLDAGTCTCPDYRQRNATCKHLFAVQFHRSLR
ncbi:MAG: ribonuclease HI [Halobacteriales archaeon]|jgi:ribonuclease HI